MLVLDLVVFVVCYVLYVAVVRRSSLCVVRCLWLCVTCWLLFVVCLLLLVLVV